MSQTLATVTQTTDSVEVTDLISVSYDEPAVTVTDMPKFELRVPNAGGINAYKLHPGKEVSIKRGGVTVFNGIIETSKPKKDARGSFLEIRGIDKGYHFLRRNGLFSYDFDEDGDPSTVRDGVTVNPHATFVMREPDSALDSYGRGYPVHGVSLEKMIQHFAGSKFIHQIDFQDNSEFLASDIYATTNTLQVYRDGASGDKRPSLQRVRKDGDGFHENAVAEKVESIPFLNGDPYIKGMADISNVSVVLIGERTGTDDPVIEVCRNAGDATGSSLVNEATRIYSSISLAHTASYNGSGLSAWTGTVDLSADGATEKGMLGFRIRIEGADDDATTTKLYYAYLEADLDSDLGLTEGTVSPYSNPTALPGLTVTSGVVEEKELVEGDFLGMTRIQAIERLREQTEADSASNKSPHWDFYVDSSQTFHFTERRGTDKSRAYTFNDESGRTGSDGTLLSVSHEYYGGEIAYQTIAYGTGSGTAQNRIVSKAEYSAGGLYDSDRDPNAGGTNQYTSIAQVRRFIDSDESSAVALLRKARAFHRIHREPTEKFDVEILSEHVPFFSVGDEITIRNLETRTNDSLRVVSLKRAFDGSNRERLSVTLGEPQPDFVTQAAGIGGKAETLTVRPGTRESTSGFGGSGTYFSNDGTDNIRGVYSFAIQDGAAVDRVFLKVNQLPWQATSKAVNISGATIGNEGAHTHSITGEATDAESAHTHTIPALTVNGTATPSGGSGALNYAHTGSQTATTPASTNGTFSVTTTKSTIWTSGTLTSFSGVKNGFINACGAFYNDDTVQVGFNIDIELLNNTTVIDTVTVVTRDDSSGTHGADTQTAHPFSAYFDLSYFNGFEGTAVSTPKIRIRAQRNDSSSHIDDVFQFNGSANGFTTDKTLGHANHSHSVNGTTTVSTASNTGSAHSHNLTGVATGGGSTHTHTFAGGTADLDFGIYQFDGDSGDGTGAPVFGKDVSLAVDPELTSGQPSDAQFIAAEMPHSFGAGGNTTQSIEVDITGYLEIDATSGTIANGEHRVWFEATPDTTHATPALRNASGLSVVSVTPIIKFKEAST